MDDLGTTDATALTVNLWAKTGRCRAYVNEGDAPLGYVDLDTMDVVAKVPGSDDVVRDTVGAYLHRLYVSTSGREPSPEPDRGPTVGTTTASERPEASGEATVPVFDPGWIDLATTAPGSRIAERNGTSYADGVAAEQRTAGVLATLAPTFRVLHSLPLSPSKDIDHLVIGPTGVWLLNTKFSTYDVKATPTGVYSDRYPQNWLESVTRDARVAAEHLSRSLRFDITVNPLVAVWAAELTSSNPIVVSAAAVAEHISSQALRLDPAHVDVIHAAARRSDTWTFWH